MVDDKVRTIEITFKKSLPKELPVHSVEDGIKEFHARVSKAIDEIPLPEMWTDAETSVKLTDERIEKENAFQWYLMMFLAFVAGAWMKPSSMADYQSATHIAAVIFGCIVANMVFRKAPTVSRSDD